MDLLLMDGVGGAPASGTGQVRPFGPVVIGGTIHQTLLGCRPAGENHPEQAGLPVHGGNRRVPGLRRGEVAMLAGFRVEYYTRLERGNLSGVSEGVLEARARALQPEQGQPSAPTRSGPAPLQP